MSTFDIKLQKVRSIISDEYEGSRQLYGYGAEVDSVNHNLGFQVSSKQQISSRLQKVSSRIERESGKLNILGERLDEITSLYAVTESRVCANLTGAELTEAGGGDEKAVESSAGTIVDLLLWMKEHKFLNMSVDPFSDTVDDMLEDAGFVHKSSEKWYTDKDGKWHKQDEDKDNDGIHKDASVNIYEAKWEDALLSENQSKEGKNWKASSKVEAGKAESFFKAYGGLYSMGEDGAKKFTPGFGAECGIGLTAFKASGTAEYGNELLGVYGGGEVKVASVEAKGSADAALYDENGNFNPKLKAKLSAEAIAAEAAVSGGMKLAGVKVGGKASVNIGAGAHAEAGYSDGVFSLDFGASIGIGFSVKLDIDVGEAIDAVSGAAQNAWDAICNWRW